MDSTDIPAEVFTAIFLQPIKCNRDVIKQIVQWNEAYDPSFNIVKGQFKKFIDKSDTNAQSLCVNVLKTLQILQQYKCPRNFMRAFLATIKSIFEGEESKAKKLLQQNLELYRSKWQDISIQVLQPYFEAFALKEKVNQDQINQFIQKMISTKKYNICLDFIKFLGINQNKENIDKLMAKMSNKKDASKAADYVKRLNLDPKSYPALGERLYKNTARHFLSKHGWQYAEEIFEDYPEALACVVEDLIYKKKIDQAFSICSRHKIQEYLQKEQSKEVLKLQFKGNIVLNSIMNNDVFDCPNTNKYLRLIDFGIKEQDVIWVDKNTPQLLSILEDIRSAEYLGIDTESIVGQTKFEKVDQAAIIQVSTGKKIYIFDGFKSNHKHICETFRECFDEKTIIGHSFTNDTQGIFRGFGLTSGEQVRIKKLIDICKVYKGLQQNAKYSSLAHICKQVLGKQLCKDQTLTNWKRRPLRKNQLHYAALDAHIVIEIYKTWLKEYGQIVHYHAQMENDQM